MNTAQEGVESTPKSPRRRRRLPRCLPGVEAIRTRSGGFKFRGRIMVEGQVHKGTLRDTQQEAARDVEAMRKRSRIIPADLLTVGQAMDLVLEDARRRELAEGTVRFFETHFDVLKKAFDADLPLHRITPKDIEQYASIRMQKDAKAEKGKRRVSAAGIAADLRALSRVFTLAIARGSLHENPLKRATLPKPKAKDPHRFMPAELRDVLALIRKSPQPKADTDADIIELLASTGLRLSEAARLTVSDVDLAASQFRVQGKRGPRTIPIAEHLRPLVSRLLGGRKEFPERRQDPFIIGGTDAIKRTLQRWQTRLHEPRLHPHALRHTYGTALAAAGATAHQIRRALGHATLSMTTRYVELSGADIEDVLAKIKFA